MRPFLEYVFAWEVVGLGASILLGTAYLLASDEFKKFSSARICLSVAALWLLGKLAMWGYFSSDRFLVRATLAFLVCGICGAGLLEMLRLVGRRDVETNLELGSSRGAPKGPESPSTVSPTESPTLIFFDARGAFNSQVALPLHVPPHATVHILPLEPKMSSQVSWGRLTTIASESKEVMWPRAGDTKTGKTADVGSVYKCEISNRGPKLAKDIELVLAIEFTGSRGANTGEPPKLSLTHTIVVPLLDPKEGFTLYLVNQTDAWVRVTIPTTVSLQVFGETARRSVPLERPKLEFPLDAIPDLIIGPSTLEWKNVPQFK